MLVLNFCLIFCSLIIYLDGSSQRLGAPWHEEVLGCWVYDATPTLRLGWFPKGKRQKTGYWGRGEAGHTESPNIQTSPFPA